MSKNCQFKDISKIISSGVTPSRQNNEYWENGTIPWLKTEQLGSFEIYETTEKVTELALKETSLKKYPINTLSIAMYGEGKTRGNVSILKSEMTTNQACCNIVVDEQKANYRYVYYFLKTQYSQLRRLSSGIRNNLNSNDIKEFEIRLPDSLEKQKQIASVLSSLDSRIEINNRINAELEVMAKTLYDYWFVQFDFPDENSKPYKTSGGKMVWNEELKKEIPEGWKVKRLDEIADLKAGGDKPKNYSEIQTITHQIPIYSNGITNDGLYGFTGEAKILKQSITVSARGTIGYCVLRNKPFVPIIRLIVVTPNSSYEAKFLYEGINSMEFDNSGSVQQQLTVPQISSVKVVMPSSELIKKYDTLTSSGMKKIEINKEENQQLSSIRDWLLPMLMNGQVTVGESAENKASYKIEEEMRMAAEPENELK